MDGGVKIIMASMRWHGGRKWSGSPKKLQHKMKKSAKKAKMFAVDDAEQLQDNILFGWKFDCRCGASGLNYDDGKRSLQCDVCKIWMHNRCNKVPVKSDDLLVYFYRKRV